MLCENKRMREKHYFRGVRKFGKRKLEGAKIRGARKLRELRYTCSLFALCFGITTPEGRNEVDHQTVLKIQARSASLDLYLKLSKACALSEKGSVEISH